MPLGLFVYTQWKDIVFVRFPNKSLVEFVQGIPAGECFDLATFFFLFLLLCLFLSLSFVEATYSRSSVFIKDLFIYCKHSWLSVYISLRSLLINHVFYLYVVSVLIDTRIRRKYLDYIAHVLLCSQRHFSIKAATRWILKFHVTHERVGEPRYALRGLFTQLVSNPFLFL